MVDIIKEKTYQSFISNQWTLFKEESEKKPSSAKQNSSVNQENTTILNLCVP